MKRIKFALNAMAVCGALVSPSLHAFTQLAGVNNHVEPLAGTCIARFASDSTTGLMSLQLVSPGNISVPEGVYWRGGIITNTFVITALTQSALESCGYSDVENFSQNGADAATFALEDYVGFSFRATDPSDGKTYDFEFAYSGATNTQRVIVKQEVKAVAGGTPVKDTLVEDTQALIAEFMLDRTNHVAANQPGLAHFLMTEQQGDDVGGSATEQGGSLHSSFKISRDVWVEATGNWSVSGGTQSQFFMGALGAHNRMSDNWLVGAMVQTDFLKSDRQSKNVKGRGWMVGPYFVAKLPDQPLYFEGRLLIGRSYNEVSPLNTFTDSFESNRLLSKVGVTGELNYKPLTVKPYTHLTYIEDKQKRYTDSRGNTIPSQTVHLTQAEAGLDMEYQVPIQAGELVLKAGLGAIYSDTGGSESDSVKPAYEYGRGRVNLGLDYAPAPQTSLGVSTFYDGVGASDYEGYGLTLQYSLNF